MQENKETEEIPKKRGRPKKRETATEQLAQIDASDALDFKKSIPTSAVKVLLYRTHMGRRGHLANYTTEEATDWGTFLEAIKQKYGGGQFSIICQNGNGAYIKNSSHTFTIEGSPVFEEVQSKDTTPKENTEMNKVIEELREQNRRLQTRIEEDKRQAEQKEQEQRLYAELQKIREEVKGPNSHWVETAITALIPVIPTIFAELRKPNPAIDKIAEQNRSAFSEHTKQRCPNVGGEDS